MLMPETEEDRNCGRVWIGIDCGKSGAVAVIAGTNEVHAFHTPVKTERMKRKRKKTASGKPSVSVTVSYDLRGMFTLLSNLRTVYARRELIVTIEQQQGMPRDSKKVVFSVGRGQGLWEMAATAAGMDRIQFVRPVEWKSRYVEKGADKAASVAACRQQLPMLLLRLKKDEALAEAALIADYARRIEEGAAFPKLKEGSIVHC